MMNRRGFLHVLGAAAVGAAVFDVKSLLWVPAPPMWPVAGDLVTFQGDLAPSVMAGLQLDLNDLAQRFARRLTEQLAHHPAVALREVMFKLSGTVKLPPPYLTIEDGPVGVLQVSKRLMYTAPAGLSVDEFLCRASGQICDDARRVDVFAPLGADLRQGEPFTPDVMIGLATDPESGITVRAMRFEVTDSRSLRPVVSVEVAGGTWHSWKRGQEMRV